MRIGTLLSGVALLALAGPVAAQTGAAAAPAAERAATIESVVVTARRVEESLQDVPVAVTAISGAQLENLSVVEVNDVARLTPNAYVTRSPLGGSDANFAIRGLRQDDFIVSTDPAIGVYVDGVYLGRTVGSGLDTVDLERVEVLRGPQGTLYGRNTIGGAVNLVSRRPTGEFDARVEAAVGSRELFEASAMVNGPVLGDTLAARASLNYRTQKGPGKSVYFPGRTAGDVEDWAGRLGLLFTPSESFEVLASFDFTKGRGTTRHTINAGSSTTAAPFGFLTPPFRTLPADINNDRSPNIYVDYRSVNPINNLDVWGASLTATYDISDSITFKSITAYRDLKSVAGTDFDGTGYRAFDQIVTTNQNQFSQELQLSATTFEERLSLVAGLYYFTEDFTQILPMNIRSWPVRLDPRVFTNVQQRYGSNTSYAIYSQGTFKLTEKLSVTAGLRWSEDDKELRLDDFFQNNLGVQVGPFPPGAQPTATRQIRNIERQKVFPSWTPRIGAEYVFNDAINAYVSYAEGFRSGGFNGRPVGELGNVQAFQPEEIGTWEAGLKTRLWEDRVQANFAAFTSDYTNIQTVIRDGATFRVVNAEAEIRGFEAEVLAAPTPELRLNLGLGVIDAEYTRVPTGFVFRTGNKLPLTPEVSANLGAQYTFELGDLGELAVRGDWLYTGDTFFQASNFPTELQEGYGLLNLRATWTNAQGNLSVAAYGKNVADEEYFTFGIDARGGFGPFYLFPGDPSEYGLTASFRF